MMIRNLPSVFLSFAVTLGVAPLAAQQTVVVPAPYTISAVQAKLFYVTKGTFSDDMLRVPRLSLWNTPIGEGWAKEPSNATLVVVEVSGAPNSYAENRAVELTANEGTRARRLTLRRRIEVDGVGDDGKQYVAFWLYDTGCTPIVLRVRLLGQRDSTVTEKRIPFQCGE